MALEEEAVSGSTLLGLLLGEGLEGGIDSGDSEEDTSTRSDGSHEVSGDGEGTNAKSSEGGGGGDVAVEGLDSRLVTVSLDHHLLLLELTGDISGGGARNIDPGLGEESARSQDEDNVDESVERISTNLAE